MWFSNGPHIRTIKLFQPAASYQLSSFSLEEIEMVRISGLILILCSIACSYYYRANFSMKSSWTSAPCGWKTYVLPDAPTSIHGFKTVCRTLTLSCSRLESNYVRVFVRCLQESSQLCLAHGLLCLSQSQTRIPVVWLFVAQLFE